MDATSGSVRSKETNAGNFVCDIVRDVTRADCVIINGGTLRSDSVCVCVLCVAVSDCPWQGMQCLTTRLCVEV